MARKTTKELNKDEVAASLESLQKLIDRAKVLYEQYFMGIQKIPPAQLHRDIERTIRELTQFNIRNTAMRFRLATMTQKFGSYNTYWKRTMREIEQGRYVRDVTRAGRRAAAKGQEMPPEMVAKLPKRVRERILRDRDKIAKRADRESGRKESTSPGNVHRIDEGDLLGDLGDLDLDAMFATITESSPAEEPKTPAPVSSAKKAKSPAAPPPLPTAKTKRKGAASGQKKVPAKPPKPKISARPPARKAPGAEAPPPGLSSGESRQLFDRYVKARKLVGGRTDNLSYDKLMRSLNKQAPAIMNKHKAAGVDWRVVIKDDKVVLKAKPIKKKDG